ncbi:MAG TPA: hypothetical protein VKJ47_16730 [Candidatus Binatia bacterium]|nr:hypothetical protein [Candidatus Binatia bacterium]
MEPLRCPLCRKTLEPTTGRHGLVWVCRVCRAGAATLPILRQVASRTFVNQLWQAALHHGRTSTVMCPACAQPFTEFAGASAGVNAQLKVCVRCFWVWLNPEALSSHSAAAPLPPALGQVKTVVHRRLLASRPPRSERATS